MESNISDTASSTGPIAPRMCLAHGRECGRPSVEAFSDADLRGFRLFSGAVLGRLLADGDSRRAPAAGTTTRSDRS